MNFGELISHLENETSAVAALEALGDLALLTKITEFGERYGEAPGEYVANASRRFSISANDEEWLALMGAMERSEDPSRAALERMLHWALAMDEKDVSEEIKEAGCSCGGGGSCHAGP